MLSSLTGWLATQGASLILGALIKLLLDAWATYQADRAQRNLATVQAQLRQAAAVIAAQRAELQAQADAPRGTDEAIRRLEEGSA